MKYIYIIISFFFIISGFTQNSLFLLKKDTIFITYDIVKINSNLKLKKKKIIDFKTKKKIGTSITYNLLDSLEINRKIEQEKKIKNNPGIGLHGSDDIHFGIHFAHESARNKLKYKKIKKTPSYKIYKKSFLKIKIKTYHDSVAFDKKIFMKVLRTYQRPNNHIKFKETELKNNQVIHFDGSTKVYEEIKKISKEPIYIYILDKIELNKCDNKKYYHFNEVSVVSKPIVR